MCILTALFMIACFSKFVKYCSGEDNQEIASKHSILAFSFFLCYNMLTDISTEFGGMIS